MMILEQFRPADEPITQPLCEASALEILLPEAAMQGALLDGTMIATDNGWRPVESLAPGDRVLTLQNGFRQLRIVERQSLAASETLPEDLRPLRVPPNVLGNVTPMALMPGQLVLRDADAAGQEIAPELIEAKAFAAEGAAQRFVPSQALSLTRLCLAEPQLVCANYGAIVLCAPAGAGGRRRTSAEGRGTSALATISEELLSSLFGSCEKSVRAEEAA